MTWQLENTYESEVSVAKAVQTPPGTDITALFSTNPIPAYKTVFASTTLPGTTTGDVQLAVVGENNGGAPYIGGFTLAGTCTATAALQVTRSVALVGETVTISGTGCILDGASGQINRAASIPGVVTGNVAFTPPLPFGPVTAAADGTWSTTIVVPPGTPAGTYAVNATCTLPADTCSSNPTAACSVTPTGVSAQAQGTFQYAPGTLTIAVPAAPKFTG